MVWTWIKDRIRIFKREPSTGEDMPPSLPTSSAREALPATPTSRKRPSSFANREPQSIAGTKASRKSTQSAGVVVKEEPPDEYEDDTSLVKEEDNETMQTMDDTEDRESDGDGGTADDEEEEEEQVEDQDQPGTSAAILRTPATARAKPYRRRTGREQTAESDSTDITGIAGSSKRKYYFVSDVKSNRPAERFRTDILTRVRAGDYDYPPNERYGSTGVLRLNDKWREEWSHGVQVPIEPKKLLTFETARCDIPHYSSGPFRLPRQYLLSTPAPYQQDETHVVHEAPPLRIYQGDRLDEIWLDQYNRKRTAKRLLPLELSTFLNLMNAMEIKCYERIYRRWQEALVPPQHPVDEKLKIDQNAECGVCKEIECDNEKDEMIFCDNCNTCLHVNCYGIGTAPVNEWRCDMCVATGPHSGSTVYHYRLKCLLCPNSGGTMQHVIGKTDQWAHVACCMWLPEIKFAKVKVKVDGETRLIEQIESLETVKPERYALKCVFCGVRSGACYQCQQRGCATPFHVTCAQSSGVCELPFERDAQGIPVNFKAYCKKHTAMRRKASKTRTKQEIEQSDDEEEERREKIRGYERVFFLYVNYEDVAKSLGVSEVYASDVYEYWKLKRNDNNSRSLCLDIDKEIDMDTETPLHVEATARGDGEADDGTIVLRASDEVRDKLTPENQKWYDYQRQVLQKLDSGRILCDMVMKRERMKRDVLAEGKVIFNTICALDDSAVPVSARALAPYIELLEKELTPEEIAESDRIAAEMLTWQPPKPSSASPSKTTTTAKTPASSSRTPASRAQQKDTPVAPASTTPATASSSLKRRATAVGAADTASKKRPTTSVRSPVATNENRGGRGARAASEAEIEGEKEKERKEGGRGRQSSPAKNNKRNTVGSRRLTFDTAVTPATPSLSAVTRSSPTKGTVASAATATPASRRLRPQNPPDDSPAPASVVPDRADSPIQSPSLRERPKAVKYY